MKVSQVPGPGSNARAALLSDRCIYLIDQVLNRFYCLAEGGWRHTVHAFGCRRVKVRPVVFGGERGRPWLGTPQVEDL